MDLHATDGDMHMEEDSPMVFGSELNPAVHHHDGYPSQPRETDGSDEGGLNPFQTMHTIQLPTVAEVSMGSEHSTRPIQPMQPGQTQTSLRNLAVKVHIRKPGRVAWKYVGRASVVQEFQGSQSRVVIRSVSSGKVIIAFSETSEIQADKRGNFIVVACVEPSGVTSWSLNAINNSDALKLLASIELACYRCKQAISDPNRFNKTRRRIEKVVREDRRRRHNSKKEEDELVAAFGSQQIAPEDHSASLPTSNPFLSGTTGTSAPVSTNFLRAFQPSAAAAVAL